MNDYRVQRGAVIAWRQSTQVPAGAGTVLPSKKWILLTRGLGRSQTSFRRSETAAATTHATSGALIAQDATIAGTAAHVGTHVTSGALTAQSAQIAGAAVNGTVVETSGGGLPVWLAREVRKKLRERQEQEAARAEPKPEPVVTKKPAKVAAVLAPMPVANIAPAPSIAPAPKRVQVDVVPMARDWLADWTQRHGVRLAPAAYAELMDVASSALVGVPHDFAAPMVDQMSMQAAIQQYETARRQQEDELLMLM